MIRNDAHVWVLSFISLIKSIENYGFCDSRDTFIEISPAWFTLPRAIFDHMESFAEEIDPSARRPRASLCKLMPEAWMGGCISIISRFCQGLCFVFLVSKGRTGYFRAWLALLGLAWIMQAHSGHVHIWARLPYTQSAESKAYENFPNPHPIHCKLDIEMHSS